MFGPILVGTNGVMLRTPTLDDHKTYVRWMLEPETSRFWGGRMADVRDEAFEERHKKDADDPNSVSWAIAYADETVGFTGLFGIDWIARDCESGIFIGRKRSVRTRHRVRSRAPADRVRLAGNGPCTGCTTGSRNGIGVAAGRTRKPATAKWAS